MKKLLLLSLLTTLFIGTASQQSLAQVIAPQPCDPQFYKQMSSRAWLEAEREIMQNQNLIFKADSVLEYTCFDQFASIAAGPGGDIFTHTTYFGAPIIPRGTPFSLEIALDLIVGESIGSYQDSAFPHNWLGGRGDELEMEKLPFEPIVNGAAYECGIMAEVWQKAKCLNFVHNEAFGLTDGFYPFDEIECAPGQAGCEPIAGYTEIVDTRKYPSSLQCNSESDLTSWGDEIRFATNEEQSMYLFQEPLGLIFEDVLDKTFPGLCGKPGIPTGVTVVLATGPAHEDGVCTNPGCTYTAGGGCE